MTAPGGALLIAGTASDAGKSVLTAGLCRVLARRGLAVAPFKAQNMSLNSAVTADGAEIGRAQAMQAAAAGVEPEAVMNPVLLKPGSDTSSQVVLLGRPVAEVDALSYRALKARLMDTVLASLADLRSRFDVVICEGAGSPAEINLRATDVANLGLARAAGLPVLVVGDIDRGGVFASLYGTLAVLDPADQAHIAGFVINKFRGAPELLAPGLEMLRGLTGRPVLGTLPWLPGVWLDVEDSLDLEADRGPGAAPLGESVLRVSVIRLPRISNSTDLDALAAEPGVVVRLATRPEEIADADLVVLPGSRATVSDLAWLRERGLAAALGRRVAAGGPVLGICGGLQMLGRRIVDDVESRAGEVPGLGLLALDTVFAPQKTVRRCAGSALGHPVTGYEIHHGQVRLAPDADGEPFLDGWRRGPVFATTWHGCLESDGFRRALLREVATATGRRFTVAPDTDFAALRERRLDVLADAVADHLDVPAVLRLIASGTPRGLPVLTPRLTPAAPDPAAGTAVITAVGASADPLPVPAEGLPA